MTMDVVATRRTGAVCTGNVRALLGPSVTAPDVALPTIDGAASEAEVRAFLAQAGERINEYVAQFADPETALMALSNLVERSGMRVNREQVDGQRQIRQEHLARQAEAARKAAEDQKTASFWGLLAKIASYVGAVVGVVAGVAIAAVTGGAGLVGAAAIIGAIAGGVGLASQATGDIASELLRNDPTAARNLNGGFQIASAVLGVIAAAVSIAANPLNALGVVSNVAAITGHVGSGFVQSLQMAGVEVPAWIGTLCSALAVTASAAGVQSVGSASSTAAQRMARTLQTVSSIVKSTTEVTAGVSQIASARFTHDADMARIEARQHGHAARRALEALQELTEQLRDLAESLTRERGRTLEMATERSRVSANIARNFVRA